MSMVPTLADWLGNCCPGLDHAIHVLNEIYTVVKNVKVYRRQCTSLADRCRALLWTLDESLRHTDMEGTDVQHAADVAEATMQHVLHRLETWGALSRIKSILQQSDIHEGIEESNRKLDSCADQLHISLEIINNRYQREQRDVLARDHAEIRELLQSILSDQNDRNTIIGLGESAVQSVMQSAQEELLHSPTNSRSQSEDSLARGLWHLQRETHFIPPLSNLTGQVTDISRFPVSSGGYNDIYTGKWLGAEKVALALPRPIVSATARRKFLKEVEIWRHLQHPNVARLYGITYVDDQHFTVSPWQENGTAMEYVLAHPEVDRLRLLTEVASGLEYLHLNRVVHGDLRGANVLISDTGRALISDFGLSKVIEEVAVTTSTGIAPSRWTAPELHREHVSVSPQTDAWSFGMLCLELMTGQRPFHYISRDMEAVLHIIQGALPHRPDSGVIQDGLWDLMIACWQSEPGRRPPMSDVSAYMRRLDEDPHSLFLGTIIGPSLSESPGRMADTEFAAPSAGPPQLSRPTEEHRHRDSTSRTSQDGRGLPGLSPSQPVNIRAAGSHSPVPSSRGLTREPSDSSSIFLESVPSDSPTSPVVSSLWQSTSRKSEEGRAQSRNQPGSLSMTRPSAGEPSLSNPPLRTSTSENGSARPGRSTGHDWSEHASQNLSTTPIDASPTRPTYAAPLDSPGQVAYPSPKSDLGRPSLSHSLESSYMAPTIESSMSGHSPQLDQTSLNEDVQNAVMDSAPEVVFADGDVIAGGTAEGLVEQLLRPDRESYRRVFLSTYRLFLTPMELYTCLIRRFDETHRLNEGEIPLQYRSTIRYNVLSVFTEWLRTRDIDKESAVLCHMKRFADSVDNSCVDTRLAREIVGMIDPKLKAFESAQQTSLPLDRLSTTMVSAEHVTHRKLAAALTVLEGCNYSNITHTDWILHFRTPSVRSCIDVALETGIQLQNWVKRSILRLDDVEKRAKRYKFFFDTAEACGKLHNYASLAAIAQAMQSPVINQLHVTQERALRNRNHIQKLYDMVDEQGDYQNYRRATEACNNICVPVISVHLSDVRRRCTEASMIEYNGRYLLNFQRCTQLDRYIKELPRYTQPDLGKDKDAGVSAYLQYHLNRYPKDNQHERELEAISQDILQVEAVLKSTRYASIFAAGFDPIASSSRRT
ncbi:hypothetical protein OE88DRAFT_1030281 [Heliocybe sulcata]|uniref:Uncharacterized protein n=1 Tax=Heliocybe sulcata TaxID=5364 RepID=A0A5C3NEI6_9AGAM|nr:hypothetical protein OE88DRAFT_1030281 [Heliocybe sulcata]